jgi:hypothetical protein
MIPSGRRFCGRDAGRIIVTVANGARAVSYNMTLKRLLSPLAPVVLTTLFIVGAVAIPGFWASAHAQDDDDVEGYKVLGTVIPTFTDTKSPDDVAEDIQLGVFKGDYVGCEKRKDLLNYNKAENDGDRGLMKKLTSNGKCVPLDGIPYFLLKAGFGTSAVVLSTETTETHLWVMSKAVVESPPPKRELVINF